MSSPFRILVVCTANICRSVMAERMLQREIEARGLDVEISSCGLMFDGAPASDTVLAVLAERDIDAHDHRSHKFTPALLDGVDLVVTMERRHARELAVAVEGASPRIHTLGALVEWLGSPAAMTGVGGEDASEPTPTAQIATCAAGRPPSALLGGGPDEVDDPHGQSKRVHRKAADRIDGLCRGLIAGLFRV